jgi:HD-GYP domain-containing protein (c-di-GMP phosphodiesterase class II)
MTFGWLACAKKDLLIDLIIKKNWSKRTKTELQKDSVDSLRKKVQFCLQSYGTLKDIQKFEERINIEQKNKEEKKIIKNEENKKKKDSCISIAKQHLMPGHIVMVFDEIKIENRGRLIKQFYPIKSKVIKQENDGKSITVEFVESRPWYEAGGHFVYKGQQMKFKFDPVTCTWLREGLTPEVVRTIGSNGKSRYFELSYTRQYLILPQ